MTFSTPFAQSQLGGAPLEGIVIKAEGETIPEANITVKSLDTNYTRLVILARNLDGDSNERNFSTEITINTFELSKERALSNQDVRHNFIMSGILNLHLGFKFSQFLLVQ
jgi:hypothetical protein